MNEPPELPSFNHFALDACIDEFAVVSPNAIDAEPNSSLLPEEGESTLSCDVLQAGTLTFDDLSLINPEQFHPPESSQAGHTHEWYNIPNHWLLDGSSVFQNAFGERPDPWANDMVDGLSETPSFQVGEYANGEEQLLPLDRPIHTAPKTRETERRATELTGVPPSDLSSALINPNPPKRHANTKAFVTNAQRWQATLSRSRAADQSFLYGVLTTKIFCRPSCPSRRPLRKHVKFFPFPGAIEAAEKTKLRPCKRCIPEKLGVANTGVQGVCKVIAAIISGPFEPCTDKPIMKSEDLARVAGMSTFHFLRIFKATTQMTPGDFVTACSSLALQDLLRLGKSGEKVDVDNIIKSHWPWGARTARKALGGISPMAYAKGATDQMIEHSSANSPVGVIHIAFSGNGAVHAVDLADHSNFSLSSHFITATSSATRVESLSQCIKGIEMDVKDRDSEIPSELLPILWRARVWLKIVHDNVLGQ